MTIVQTQCCQFFILIKRVDVTNGGWSSFATRVGCSYLQLKKAIYNFEKIKSKSYVQWEKVKKKAMYNSKSKN